MRINKNKSSKKLIVTLVIVALLTTVGVYAYYHKNTNNNSVTADTMESQPNTDEEQSKALKESPDNKEKVVNSDRPPEPETIEGSELKSLQVTATANISSGTLYIRGGVNYPVEDGRCFATLVGPGGQKITKDTTLLQNPSSTDCKTIQISTSELTSGKWTISLNFESSIYVGKSPDVTVTI